MTAFKRFDTAAFFKNLNCPVAATAASAANPAPNEKYAADAASAAGVDLENHIWVPQDYKAYHDERAAIMEYDGGLNRAEAEQQAYECGIVEWLNRYPPQHVDDQHCSQCGKAFDGDRTGAVSVLAGHDGHVWLHSTCHEDWMRRRRREAVNALGQMGIADPAVASRR